VTIGRVIVLTLRLALPLYLLSLALGLIGTLLALIGLGPLADRPWLATLLGPDWLNTLVEVGASAVVAPPRDRTATGLLGLEALLVTPMLVMLQWIGYSLLAGGILERLVTGISLEYDAGEAPPPNPLPIAMERGSRGDKAGFSSSVVPRRGMRISGTSTRLTFWADCRRWFWPFVWLGALGTLLFVVLVVLGLVAAVLASRAVGMTAGAVALACWVAVLLGWLELARAAMVWRGSRSVGQALELATWLVIRPRALLLWLVLALPSLGLLALTTSAPGGESASALSALAAFVIGQIVAFLGAWLKVIRLAVACRLVAGAVRQKSGVSVG